MTNPDPDPDPNFALIEEAMALLGTRPLPADAAARLAAMQAQAPTDRRWGALWEAFYAAGGTAPEWEATRAAVGEGRTDL